MNVTVPSSNTSHGVLKLVCAALLWVICFSLARGQQTCYWPNGTPAESPDYKEYLPCHDGNSTCCAVNEICISNGLCFGSIIEQVKDYSCDAVPYGSSILTPFRSHIEAPAQIRIGPDVRINIAMMVR